MARRVINLGTGPNTKTGDSARVGGDKINLNFEEVYTALDILARIDIIVENKGSSLVGNDLTVNANWEWLINNTLYTNLLAVLFEDIALSSAGKTRLVYVVPNDENGFDMLDGEEAVLNPQPPYLPNGGMYVTYFEVTDTEIGALNEAYDGEALGNKLDKNGFEGTAKDLVAKIERQKVTISDNVSSFTLNDERHFVEFTNASQGDFNYFIQDTGYVSGQNHPFRIRNNTGVAFTLKHLVPSGSSIPGETMLFFPNGNDFELKDKEIIEFVYDADNNRYGYFGIITDISDYYTKSEVDTALGLKVDKDGSKVLSDNNYSTSEKNKLASIDATHYLPPLQTTVQLSALPQASISDKARVYVENELSDYFYDATASSGDIAPDDQTGGVGFWRQVAVGGETAASIKTKYESNPDTNAFTDAEQAKVAAISGANTGDETAASIAAINHGATAKSTLVDADEITGQDSANSYSLIRVTCLNIYNYLKAKFDSVYQAVLTDVNFGAFINGLTSKTTPIDADSISIVDSADSNKQKKVSLTNFKAYLKTYFDGQYQNITPNVQSVTSSSTVTPVSTNDTVVITAQAANLTLANPTGSFQQGQALFIRIKDNGTARTITYGSNYRAIGVNLPTTTVISKTTYMAIVYNSTDAKWDIIGAKTQV